MNYKLGLRPSLNFKLHFGNYIDLAQLPPIPDEIDWSPAVSMTKPYAGTMFGNDRFGDCFFAAAAKCLMTQSANAGDMLKFTTDDVLEAYAAATGFDPNDPNTDQGTEPVSGFKFLQTTGIKGVKFGPPLSISPTRVDLVMAALHLGGCLMVGVDFLSGWEDAPVWNGTGGASKGGHEIPSMKASRTKGVYVETWGEDTFRFIPWGSLAHNCNQLTVCLNPAFFVGGQAPNGLDMATVDADAALITN